MTTTFYELLIYAGAVAVLFLTPGPVWAALIARALSGGFSAAWPLAVGVALGDMFWPVLAVFGVTWLVSLYADFLILLRYGGALMLAAMGGLLVLRSGRKIERNDRLAAPGAWAGFSAGILIIIGNPKAILFYMGVLPGFFDVASLKAADIAAIAFVSLCVPLIGNIALAGFLHKSRVLISSQKAMQRINIGSGIVLICVGLFIALS